MTSAPPLDLLREKRQELGLPDPGVETAQSRQWLLRGVAIGAALIGLSLGLGVLVALRNMMVSAQLERLRTVEAEAQLFQAQLSAAKGRLNTLNKANKELVDGIVAVRSGSAVLRDLQTRVPEGIQLTSAVEQAGGYRLKGVAQDPSAFARINALQLQLKRSPLVDPNGVTLVKASRGKLEDKPGDAAESNSPDDPVNFELVVKMRPPISPLAEKQILSQLGAEGLVRRLDLLQKEGLL